MEVCSSIEMGAPGASHLGTGDREPGVGPNPPAADFAYHMESVACGPESSTRPIATYNPISLRRASPMT